MGACASKKKKKDGDGATGSKFDIGHHDRDFDALADMADLLRRDLRRRDDFELQ